MRDIILRPIVSEKTADQIKLNQYTFIVESRATKIDVKNALKRVYSVDAVRVNILNTCGKRRRRGRIVGYTSGIKKAIVTLKEGQELTIVKKMF